jgi:radical SAM superfamily enzyme YgiQ (UPF0313 family)
MGETAKKMRKQEATIPYGVLSIATYILSKTNSNREDIYICDLNIFPYNIDFDDSLKLMLHKIKEFKPEIIGISAMYNHQYPYITLIADHIKKEFDITIIAGGCCVMAFYDRLLQEVKTLDAICYSEGEIPVCDLLTSDDINKELKSHPSYLTVNEFIKGKQPQAVFINDLDEIPPIDFDLINIDLYSAGRTSFRPEIPKNERMLPITTTRGCPYNCVFCVAGSLHGKKVRKLSAMRVVSDVKLMIEKYGINVLTIEDDQFLIHKERTKEMLRGLAKLNLQIIADSGFTIELLDDEISKLLKEAGLLIAVLAIESGSPRVLKDIIDKPLKLEKVAKAVASLRKNGLLVHSFLVIGFPGETEEDRQLTIDFIIKTGIDWCYLTCATPVKGSRLYDICIEKGYLAHDVIGNNAYYASVINTPEFTSEWITRKAYLMNLELNFINNYRIKIGDYNNARKYMQHIVNKYPDHAFAHYYLAKSYLGLNRITDAESHIDAYNSIIKNINEWTEYAKLFELKNLNKN